MKKRIQKGLLVLGAVLFCLVAASSSYSAQGRGVTVRLKESERPGAADAGTVRLYSASYALVIGIDEYNQGWPRLSNAVKDASLVADKLREQGFDVTLKQNLNSRDLQSALEEFYIYKGQDPEARLFLWFAGHGHTLDGEGFLIPTDAPLPSKKALFKIKALSMRRFGELVRLAESKHALAMFDSCFSGTVFTTSRAAPPPAITRHTTLPVREYISSGDANQEVSDDGRFRRLFVKALEGTERADLNQDGYLSGSELGMFLSNRVANLTANRQTPRYGKLRDEKWDQGDFVFLMLQSSRSVSTQTVFPEAKPLPKEGGTSFDDFEKYAEEQRKAKEAWSTWQNERGKEYQRARALDGNDDLNAEQKAELWRRFYASVSQDNPYSGRDEEMRSYASLRKTYWERQRSAPPKPVAATGSLDFTGLKVNVVHTAGRKDDAEVVRRRLEGSGATVMMTATSDTGNSSFEGKIFTEKGYEDKARQIARSVSDIETVSLETDRMTASSGQQFNLWIAKKKPSSQKASLSNYDFSGLKVNVVYVKKRKNDAEVVRKRLESSGATVMMTATSDSGNGPFVGRIFTEKGYEDRARQIAKSVSDIETVVMETDRMVANDGQQFNLWIAR